MAAAMACAVSGVRLAAAKQFDLFGAYVIGLVTAIGGGTLRDIMLGVTPFWMERSAYVVMTAISLILVLMLGHHIIKLKSTFFIFDAMGLAFFTIAGYTKTLAVGFPIWVAMIMGVITGCFGGVIRDILIGEVPLLFRRDVYAVASIFGGVLFAVLSACGVNDGTSSIVSIAAIIAIRVISVKMRINVPVLFCINPNSDPDSEIDSESATVAIHVPKKNKEAQAKNR